jgi:hypothetical protein
VAAPDVLDDLGHRREHGAGEDGQLGVVGGPAGGVAVDRVDHGRRHPGQRPADDPAHLGGEVGLDQPEVHQPGDGAEHLGVDLGEDPHAGSGLGQAQRPPHEGDLLGRHAGDGGDLVEVVAGRLGHGEALDGEEAEHPGLLGPLDGRLVDTGLDEEAAQGGEPEVLGRRGAELVVEGDQVGPGPVVVAVRGGRGPVDGVGHPPILARQNAGRHLHRRSPLARLDG